MSATQNIWCNAALSGQALEILNRDLSPYSVIFSNTKFQSNLHSGGHDPAMSQASIAFGQPDAQQVIDSPNIKWVHLTSAGYTRYDTDEFRKAIKDRNGIMTNSSQVYAEPCAQHAMAMIMAVARQLPVALDDQRTDRKWLGNSVRSDSHLLSEQSILVYGFGSIAQELVRYLTAFRMKITGVRRHATGNETVPIVSPEKADELLPHTDHVMNILPASPHTDRFFNATRLARFSPRSTFYNIGRGTTVDQDALQKALEQKQISGAYLDVTDPEPLPSNHPLWKLPNCWITPHSAGGHADERVQLVKHFRQNLTRYQAGQPLINRII